MSAQDQDLPLKGIKVLELHAIGPVPFAGMILRSLGATVVRVSPPVDPALGTKVTRDFDLLNNTKDQIYVDMKSADGMKTIHEHLATADVMLEGFRPGVLERLGLAPADVLARHPRVVIGRLSGWGTKGELADRAGHDINYLAMTGILHALGTAETPVPPLNVVGDFGGGAMYLLLGVFAKLVQRSVTGKGGVAQTSILAGSVGLSPMFYGMIAGGMWGLKRETNMLDGGRPYYRVYKTKDGRFMSVGAIEAKFYAILVNMLGLDGQVDLKKQNDPASWPDTVAKFTAAFASRTRDEWGALAAKCDACAAPVLDFVEAAGEAHNVANSLYKSQPFPQPDRIVQFRCDPGRAPLMLRGVAFALGAGLLWGLVFIAPLLLPEYSALALSVGRYLAFGLVVLPVALADRRAVRQLTRADWVEALKLSLVGNLAYYAFLAAAIQLAGAPMPTMIIGTLPVVIALVSNLRERELPWRSLAGSIALLTAGIALLNREEMRATGLSNGASGPMAQGAAFALGAVACWTWYPIRNARWLKRHPTLASGTWATAQGLATLPLSAAGALALGLWHGFEEPLGPQPVPFVALMLTLGLCASWLGTLCWNRASQLLPTSLAGQTIVFETLAALVYAFAWRAQVPSAAAFAGIGLLLAGVIAGVRSFQPAGGSRAG